MEGKRGEENIPSACDSAEGREERRGRKGRGNAHLDLSAGRLYNYFSVPVCHTGARSRSRSIRALPATVIVPCKNLLCSLSLRGTFEWPCVSPLSTPSHSADASGRRHRHNHARSVRLFADRRSTTWRAPSTDRRVATIAISAQTVPRIVSRSIAPLVFNLPSLLIGAFLRESRKYYLYTEYRRRYYRKLP